MESDHADERLTALERRTWRLAKLSIGTTILAALALSGSILALIVPYNYPVRRYVERIMPVHMAPPTTLAIPEVDRATFESLYHACKAVQGATAVGVNYQRFGELLQAMSTELSIARDRARSQAESEIVQHIATALDHYSASDTVWKNQIESARYNWIPKGRIFVESDLWPVVNKYDLPTQSHGITGSKWTSISTTSMQLIWLEADRELTEAYRRLN